MWSGWYPPHVLHLMCQRPLPSFIPPNDVGTVRRRWSSERILVHGENALKGGTGTLAPPSVDVFVLWLHVDGFA